MKEIKAYSEDDLVKAAQAQYDDDVTVEIMRPIELPNGIGFNGPRNIEIKGHNAGAVLKFKDMWPGDWSKVVAGNGIELNCGNVVFKRITFHGANGWGSVVKRHANYDRTKQSNLLLDSCRFMDISTIVHPFKPRGIMVKDAAGNVIKIFREALDPLLNTLKIGDVLPEGTVLPYEEGTTKACEPWTASLVFSGNCVGGSGDAAQLSRIDCFNTEFINCCTNNSYAHVNYTQATKQLWKGNKFIACGSMQSVGSTEDECWHAWIDNQFLNPVKVTRGNTPPGPPYLIYGGGGKIHMEIIGNYVEGDYSNMYYYAVDNKAYWHVDHNTYVNVNRNPNGDSWSTWSYDYAHGHYVSILQWLAAGFDRHSVFA